MTNREQRVVNAFIECVKYGEFSEEYACVLIENEDKYGFLTAEAKEAYYTGVETMKAEKAAEEEAKAAEAERLAETLAQVEEETTEENTETEEPTE